MIPKKYQYKSYNTDLLYVLYVFLVFLHLFPGFPSILRVVFSPGHVGSLTDGALWDDLGRAAARQRLRCPIHLGISVGALAAEKNTST